MNFRTLLVLRLGRWRQTSLRLRRARHAAVAIRRTRPWGSLVRWPCSAGWHRPAGGRPPALCRQSRLGRCSQTPCPENGRAGPAQAAQVFHHGDAGLAGAGFEIRLILEVQPAELTSTKPWVSRVGGLTSAPADHKIKRHIGKFYPSSGYSGCTEFARASGPADALRPTQVCRPCRFTRRTYPLVCGLHQS